MNQKYSNAQTIESNLKLLISRNPGLGVLFERFEFKSYKWAIVGGAPRAWLLKEREPRDIDIVLNTDQDKLDALVHSLKCFPQTADAHPRRNSFGGYKLTLHSMEVDLWAAASTYAIVNGHVRHRVAFQAVSKAAILSTDSIVFTSTKQLYGNPLFRDAWECRQVQFRNPPRVAYAEKLMTKAIRLCLMHRLVPNLVLQMMIVQHFGTNTLKQLLRSLNDREKHPQLSFF